MKAGKMNDDNYAIITSLCKRIVVIASLFIGLLYSGQIYVHDSAQVFIGKKAVVSIQRTDSSYAFVISKNGKIAYSEKEINSEKIQKSKSNSEKKFVAKNHQPNPEIKIEETDSSKIITLEKTTDKDFRYYLAVGNNRIINGSHDYSVAVLQNENHYTIIKVICEHRVGFYKNQYYPFNSFYTVRTRPPPMVV